MRTRMIPAVDCSVPAASPNADLASGSGAARSDRVSVPWCCRWALTGGQQLASTPACCCMRRCWRQGTPHSSWFEEEDRRFMNYICKCIYTYICIYIPIDIYTYHWPSPCDSSRAQEFFRVQNNADALGVPCKHFLVLHPTSPKMVQRTMTQTFR